MTKYERENSDSERLQPMQPLLEEFERAIEAKLRGEEVPTPASIDNAINQAFAEVAPSLITARLRELSPEEFADVYVRVLGNKALQAQLDELAAIKTAELQRQARLAEIRREAKDLGMLRLEHLETDELVKIGLFNPYLPPQFANKYQAKKQEYSQKRPLQRILAARILDPAQSRIEVIYDNWVGAVWDDALRTPGIPPLSQGTVGKYLTIHAPLVFKTESQDFHHKQIIGYVETNDGTLLLDGNS